MQFVHNFDDPAILVGWGVNVTLLTDKAERGKKIGSAISGYGATVDWQREARRVLDTTALIVVDCDAVGGLAAGRLALQGMVTPDQLMGAILISSEVASPEFPQDPFEPVVLRGPVSLVALRVGFEHALRAQFA